MHKKAVILFSGGLDSTTCIALAKEQGFSCYALSFDYMQKHSSELTMAKRIIKAQGDVVHRVVQLQLNASALTSDEIAVQDYTGDQTIPNTYVPARNTIFLSIALGWAEELGAQDIFIGANVIDYSGYPDCRPDYLRAFETMANLATKAGVEGAKLKIHAPLLSLSKAGIIQEGVRLGIDYSTTVSCYRADDAALACGTCDSCVLRQNGFVEAGVKDPTRYVTAIA
jgi:7-cyano-7-deazaguanine synthase